MNPIIQWLLTQSPDDSFYYIQLISGKTALTETNGYHPLWPLVLSPLGFLLQGEALILAVAAVYFGIVLALPFVIRRLYGTWAGLALWALPTWYGNTMMELALSALMVFLAIRFRNGWVSGLMAMARLDLAPLALLLAKDWRDVAKAGLVMLPWAVFNLSVFQTILPDSAGNILPGFTSPGTVLGVIDWNYPLVITGLGLIGVWKLEDRRLKFALLGQLAFILIADISRNALFSWHYPIIPAIVVFGLDRLMKMGEGWRFWAKGLTGITAVAYLCFHILQGPQYEHHLRMARDVSAPGTLGALNSGIIGYYSEQKVWNLDGVFNHNPQLTEYIVDWDRWIPPGYARVEDYGGEYGLWKRDGFPTATP